MSLCILYGSQYKQLSKTATPFSRCGLVINCVVFFQGLAESVYVCCFEILQAIIYTSERNFGVKMFSGVDYQQSDLCSLHRLLSLSVPGLLPHLSPRLQQSLLFLSSKRCAWDDGYLLEMLDMLTKNISKIKEFDKVAAEMVLCFCQMSMAESLAFPVKANEPQIKMQIEHLLESLSLGSRILLYTKLRLCLQDEPKTLTGGTNMNNDRKSWRFVYLVREVLIARWIQFMCCPSQCFELGSLVEIRADDQVHLAEPLCLLGKLLIRMGNFHNCIDSSCHPSPKSHLSQECRNSLDILDQSVVKGIICFIRWICSLDVYTQHITVGLQGSLGVQCTFLVSTQLILLLELLLAELVEENGLAGCVLEGLQDNTVHALRTWMVISNLDGLPCLLGSLLCAHRSLWDSVYLQFREWELTTNQQDRIYDGVWSLTENSLFGSLDTLEKKWMMPYVR